jgi:hypothetical protein
MRAHLLLSTLLAAAPATARADATDDDVDHDWHTGLNLRTDTGTHRVRLDAGLRLGTVDVTAVLDPKVFIDRRQNDTDLVAEYMFRPDGWAAMAGWRLTQISIDRGTQFHHMLLLGVSAGLPRFLEVIVPRFGFEFEANVLRHGDGLESDTLSLASERDYRDLLSINLFLRFDYAVEM